MYIWRGKNRRDKRNFLLGGEEYWGAPSGSKSFDVEDEILRHEQEMFHINYFTKRIELLMQQYLDTPDGMVEVRLMLEELSHTRSKESDYRNFDDFDTSQKEKMKKNIFEIYRMFSDNYSELIDREGLRKLLDYLGMQMPDKHFDLWCRSMRLNEVYVLLEFEVFYASKFLCLYQQLFNEVLDLLKQMKEEAKRRNGWLKKISSIVGSNNPTNEEAENESSLSYHFQKKFELIEAKLVLVDHAVYQAELASRAEYRVAHPSKMICEICDESFGLRAELTKHLKDNAYHREKLRKKIANEQRFVHVEKIFVGEQGRKLSANRLIFSRDLDNLQHRVDVAIKDPFRPKISDPEGKRYAQQLNGAFVQGFDPKSGIRPIYSQNGMIRQHLAPLRNKSAVNSIIQRAHPTLQVVLNDLLRCKDDFIDTVSTYDTHMESRLLAANAQSSMDVEEFIMGDSTVAPLYATVRIVFNDFADGHIWIIGEFNGWKPEPMLSDMTNRTWYVIKKLCPGHYRYRFIINKTHAVDSIATVVEDESSPIGKNNVVMVTNTAIRHQELQIKKNGGITKTGLILPNETSNDVLKIGYGASTSMSVSSSTDESQSQVLAVASPLSRKSTAAAGGAGGRGSTAGGRSSAGESESRVTTANSAYYEGKIMHISRTDKNDLIKRLQHINLRNCALFDDGTWAFSIYVRKNSFIVTLDLSYNYISDEGMQLLGLCLLNLEALTDLKLNGNGFGMDGVRSIVDNLGDKQTLTNLEFANNRLGDDGMEVICNFLHYNQHILHLYVDSCYIGNEGMECLHHALLLNNTLLSISLSGNVIKMLGACKLCKALRNNASLKVLNLNNNPLGPEGARYVGDMIAMNHTLEQLQIANVGMMEIQSSYGAHHICTGLAQNKGLQKVNLKNNKMDLDHIVLEFAEMLRAKNTTLTELDLSGNQIKDKRWFQPDTSINVLLGKSLPSIETSLQRNRQELEARMEREKNLRTGNIHQRHVKIKDVKSTIVKGKWSSRREWLKVVVADVDKLRTKMAISQEHSRIEAERVYIKEKLAEHMQLMQLYLDQPPCKSFLQMVGKFIVQYVKDLPKVSVKDLPDRDLHDGQPNTAPVNMRQELLMIKSGEFSSSVPSSAMNRLLTPLEFVRSMSSSDVVARLVPSTAELKRQLRSISPFTAAENGKVHKMKNVKEELSSTDNNINLPSFLNAHVSILMAMFNMLGNGTTPMMINPEQVEQLFQMLALPIPREEVQHAVNECIVPKMYKIGLHKMSEFILQNAAKYSLTNKMQRFRILSDMKFNPPVKEAHHIILDNIQHIALVELRNNYRMLPENRPLFVCPYCKKRFATEKRLKNHVKRGYTSAEHRRQRVKEVIHRSQSLFLQEVKCVINGVFFPAYYELAPAKQLPDDYFPQVMDKIGSEGRPFGVVEPNRTVRAVDVFGEYLHVLLHNKLGWLRYRRGNQEMLHPACKGREGFDWNKMHIQESITYYRVNDALPENAELKVRHMPLLEAEVCGYLHKNQVIECIAVIGDWIQVRYQKEDAAWVMWRTKRANDPLTNQTTLRVPVTINRPDRKATAASTKRSKKKLDDAISVEQQHDDHFKDALLSYEIHGEKFTVNPEREKYKHITRAKIEEFNEVRYGHTFKQVNPNEAEIMELLILLPQKLQYNMITKDADPLVQLPSPSIITEQEIFDYIMNKEGKVYDEDPAEMSVESQDWLAGEGGNRFGLSTKDEVYGFKDEEDRVESDIELNGSDDDDDIGFAGEEARAKMMGELKGALANSPNMMARRRKDVRLSEYDFSQLKSS